ncbi:killer suppression protein HigA [Candidatus Thiomargarita nelsonii]|uniref:Killer suppression protein HigA n=1 Tax=Candidatus Thiomargarita nelsonii TaxID=1003181 RepID=A0A176RSU3_9GAMM|nr:killer suppression protein HigA [Candidatus Thiomargarita nelsonii]
MYPEIQYDQENELAYIALSDSKIEKSIESEDELFVYDVDKDGELFGIEILSVERLRENFKSIARVSKKKMNITFKTKKLQKLFNQKTDMIRKYGERRAKLIQLRLVQLQAAQSLADLGPPYSGPARCHELRGNRAGIFSVDLEHPYRLLFCPKHEPVPTREEG